MSRAARAGASPADTAGSLDLVDLAARINPRRPYLLVSRVLAKHVPIPPERALAGGVALALRWLAQQGAGDLPDPGLVEAALAGDDAGARALVARELTRGRDCPSGTVVIGFAETATGLGHAVADVLAGALYLHTTRLRLGLAGVPCLDFSEDHSHAPVQLLHDRAAGVRWADGDGPVVLVDDELSTGATALNLIRAVHARSPRRRYAVLSLVDTLGPVDRARIDAAGRELGAHIGVHSLRSLALDRGGLADGLPDARQAPAARVGVSEPVLHRIPVDAPVTARLPRTDADRAGLERAAAAVAEPLRAVRRGPAHVLGTEELMYLPQRVAALLGPEVVVSSTTRSPVAVSTAEGYPIRHGVTWPGADAPRYAYNVGPEPRPEVYLLLERPRSLEELAPMLGALAGAGVAHPHVVMLDPPAEG